ncbi:NYN domain-containing protein [Candidatus Sumerlaeota bacterium]|nr:NYN domain-containing protein [Candidatus Sumerlaeota bacterium]
MSEKSFCRIGVFYDGSYFTYAQHFFYHNRNLGWLDFQPFHLLIENTVRAQEQGYTSYKIVYAAWFQGLFSSMKTDERQLRNERNRYHDLMHAGIEPKYFPMSVSQGEKGADVALAIDALQIGLDRRIDIAALVTGDGDLIPLVRALMKQGVRVMAVYFEYEEGEYKSFINERLLRVCNYSLNVNQLEKDKNTRATFRGLFRKADERA